MKHSIIFSLLLLVFILFGCSKTKNDLIIGKWEITNTTNEKDKVNLSFEKDGSGYSLTDKVPFTWKIDVDKLEVTFKGSSMPFVITIKDISEEKMIINDGRVDLIGIKNK